MKKVSELASYRLRGLLIVAVMAAVALWQGVVLTGLPWIEWSDVDAAIGVCALAAGIVGAVAGRKHLLLLGAVFVVAGVVLGWMGSMVVDGPHLLAVWLLARLVWVLGVAALGTTPLRGLATVAASIAAAFALNLLSVSFAGWALAPGLQWDPVPRGDMVPAVLLAFLPLLVATFRALLPKVVGIVGVLLAAGLLVTLPTQVQLVCRDAAGVTVCVTRDQENRLPQEIGDVQAVARVVGEEMVPPMKLATRAEGDQPDVLMGAGVRARTAGNLVLEQILPLGECSNSGDREGMAVLRQLDSRVRKLAHLPKPDVGESMNPRHARAVSNEDALPSYPTVLTEVSAGEIRLVMRQYGDEIRQCHGRFRFFGVEAPLTPQR